MNISEPTKDYLLECRRLGDAAGEETARIQKTAHWSAQTTPAGPLVPIEMAEQFQKRGVRVVAIISSKHGDATSSKRADEKKLQDFANLVLDTGAPAGDAMVNVPGLKTPVAPGSTVGGCMLINCIKAEIAARLTAAGRPPNVLSGAAVVGDDRAAKIFDAAYDQHARLLAKLYSP